MSTTIDIVALISVRDEEHSLAHTLRNLVREGIAFVVIDNGSVDGTRDVVAREEFRPWLRSTHTLPYEGTFSLGQQLAYKTALVETLSADWVIHMDADEVLQSPVPGERLCDAILRVDREGYNVINFDEFVFLPIEQSYESDVEDFQPILSYYFFEPEPQRLMRAWKTSTKLINTDSGGHRLLGGDLQIAPESMILRHYVFRSQQHAFKKYTDRVFSIDELAQGWHGNRHNQPQACFRFPAAAGLERLNDAASVVFSRAHPRKKHYWQW